MRPSSAHADAVMPAPRRSIAWCDRVAWWFTAPNSIHVDCGCPESGTVMVREYTASFTSVKPCLYQPPPGTLIDVADRPAGVNPHVPARSTEAIAALPAVTPSVPEAGEATAAVGRGAAAAACCVPTAPVSSATAATHHNAGHRRRGGRWCCRITHPSFTGGRGTGDGQAARTPVTARAGRIGRNGSVHR